MPCLPSCPFACIRGLERPPYIPFRSAFRVKLRILNTLLSQVLTQAQIPVPGIIDVLQSDRRIVPLAAAVATVAVLLQGGASQAQTVAAKPTAKQLAAEASQLSNEVIQMDQQYDGLKISFRRPSHR